MIWTDPDSETGYADDDEIEAGAEVLLNRLERIRRLLWLGAPEVIVANEIAKLADEHMQFALRGRSRH